MSKIAITGATGQLGEMTILHLLERNVSAGDMIAVVRNPEKAKPLADLGLQIRYGDYEDEASMLAAFENVDKLLFISSPSLDNTHRIAQHARVVEAARDAKVGFIAYTSLAFPEKSALGLENLHLATEYAIRTTGIPYTFLRNGFYMDILVNPGLHGVIESGELVSASAGAKVNYVTRNDLALAAANVLTGSGHECQTYELAHPHPFTYDEFVQILSEVSGTLVKHADLSSEQAYERLVATGTPGAAAAFMTQAIYPAIAAGQFSFASEDLVKLIGNRFTTVKAALEQFMGK
ncbi:NAD(P)-dependent oxidoreductase [Paenibacillus sp. 79R4]|uniref:SDR family oxidoreductase n=1 Tax=Paenibacillus sp. 79R4 TaxID=2212847 RepID=UPI0015BDE936|nr:SDR family oxidoreductase [Paenibacillus sp. 79R4]NWL90427.1 NAD(P)-dependent oxidoreductase [Paenibacillus sp. 79R4]